MLIIAPFIMGFFAVLIAAILSHKIYSQNDGTAKMKEISKKIHDGAMTFLNREYKIMIDFAVIIFILVTFLLDLNIAIAFVFGFFLSALSGNIGMRIATRANVRTTQACTVSEQKGMLTAFHAGSASGLFVVGIGLVGIALLYYIIPDVAILYGFGFGASFAALFARVGGGIFTKAADIAADFVGKVEKGMREDDPRNPGVIADNIGDNVGDVAGMGADLFESYVDSIIAAIAIAALASFSLSFILVEYVFAIASAGVFASFFGVIAVRKHLFESILVSSVIMVLLSAFISILYLDSVTMFFSVVTGLIAGLVIGASSNYYTSYRFRPTRDIANASRVGAGRTITTGLSIGMISTVFPIIAVSGAILASYYFSGLFGIAMSAIGMLSIIGVVLASDSYGSIADNAAGIAEMSKIPRKAYVRASNLDAVGNTTAAVAKGFAMGSAALTSVALFAAYAVAAELSVINIVDPTTIVGLMIGGLLPFVFSAVTIKSVGKTASKLIDEIRYQFKHHKVDSNKAVTIATDSAIKEMIYPSLIAVISPIVVGFLLGPAALGAMLAGTIVTGFLLALTMTNAGGAWDNAKKYIEAGKLHLRGPKAHALYKKIHAASVTGDTVGDPLKDTSGPSLNILIKLISIVSLLVAILLV